MLSGVRDRCDGRVVVIGTGGRVDMSLEVGLGGTGDEHGLRQGTIKGIADAKGVPSRLLDRIEKIELAGAPAKAVGAVEGGKFGFQNGQGRIAITAAAQLEFVLAEGRKIGEEGIELETATAVRDYDSVNAGAIDADLGLGGMEGNVPLEEMGGNATAGLGPDVEAAGAGVTLDLKIGAQLFGFPDLKVFDEYAAGGIADRHGVGAGGEQHLLGIDLPAAPGDVEGAIAKIADRHGAQVVETGGIDDDDLVIEGVVTIGWCVLGGGSVEAEEEEKVVVA